MEMMNEFIIKYKETKQIQNGVNGISPFLNLEGFDFFNSVPVDPMHCLSGVIANRISIMIGDKYNNENIKLQEENDKRFYHFYSSNVSFFHFFIFIFEIKIKRMEEDG